MLLRRFGLLVTWLGVEPCFQAFDIQKDKFSILVERIGWGTG